MYIWKAQCEHSVPMPISPLQTAQGIAWHRPRSSDLLTSIEDRQYTYKRNTKALSCNHCCSGIAVSITYSECVFVALRIQHAPRMRHTILSSVTCLAVKYFSALSQKQLYDIRKKNYLT